VRVFAPRSRRGSLNLLLLLSILTLTVMRVSGLVADDDAMVRGVGLLQRMVSAMAGY